MAFNYTISFFKKFPVDKYRMFENKTYTTFFFQVVCLVYYAVCGATSQYFHRKLQNIPANLSATVKFWKNSKKHRNLLSFFDNFSLFPHRTHCILSFFLYILFHPLVFEFYLQIEALEVLCFSYFFPAAFPAIPIAKQKAQPGAFVSALCALGLLDSIAGRGLTSVSIP